MGSRSIGGWGRRRFRVFALAGSPEENQRRYVATRAHRFPRREPREGLNGRIWGAARGDAGGFGAGRGLGRLVRGSDRAIESARGFATDTAARPARRPTPAPIASFRHCHRTTPGEGRNWEKNMRRGARGPGRARGVGGAETLGGIARGVGPDAFAAEATSTGRSRAFDHPKPRANSAGGAWITPPPTNARGVNPEK